MKNFIQIDNTEEEQVEQIKKWWNSNGKQIIAGACLLYTSDAADE